MTARELFDSAEALLVDLDGTLVDSTGPVRRAWDAFAVRNELDREAVHRFAQGRPSRETVSMLAPDADQEAELARVEYAEVHDTTGVAALPAAAELLDDGRPLAIVTSCSVALAHARLRAAGLPIPDVLVTSDDVERGKPDPSCFLIGARLLGVLPEACVVLEDASAGIAAGRGAGAIVIALRTTHDDAELAGAHAILDDLTSLLGTARIP